MRKVLSFVLVLSLVLGSFSMAFAANGVGLTDVTGNANEDAIQVAYDLGIVTGNPDGTYLPDKAVNRAEFAAMITRALAIPDSALAGYTTTSFKDTAGYGWAVPYLAFCQSKGIMLGDGMGNAMPGRTITVNEAVTMALRAIGYTANSALLVGAWPANYVSIAQNEDLYDDVSTETTVNKASAAQIIYNLLTVQKVAVNSDGETIFQKDKDDQALNLLNTNLGCEADKDEILGVTYDYDNSLINITGKIGAYGTAYTNSDGDLVAFTVDSTALTGKIDGGKFKVGDVKYDFSLSANATTDTAVFVNTVASASALLNAATISSAAVAADDGKTVTINVDMSGKKIKEVYSVVAWSVSYDESDADLAPSDVQDDIEDHELLGLEFVEDDDDNIDFTSFQLVGVASLEDIEEDNVLYVYADDDEYIRKVAVGTETVDGIVEEIDEDDGVVTIDGTEYDIAANATSDAAGLDVDDEGIFYLDASGEIYDFDGSGTPDTYGVVIAKKAGDNFSNLRLKLYTSEDSEESIYLNDDADEIDWTTRSAAGATATDASILTTGTLLGYKLDSDGDIKALDVTAYEATSATFSSMKVLNVTTGTTTGSFSINSDAVVFTYDTVKDIDGGDYDVCELSEVSKGDFTGTIRFILEEGKVAALLIDEADADVEDDAIYGVFNGRTKRTVDGDPVYRFTGFIDGTSFSYLTKDDSNEGTHGDYNDLAGVFGVYAIILDASGNITKINDLDGTLSTSGAEASGKVASGVVTALGSSNTVFTIGGTKYTAEDDAVVYKFDDDEFEVSKLSAIDEDDTVALYDTKGDDADGVATVVIYIEAE